LIYAADGRIYEQCIKSYRVLCLTFPYDQNVPPALSERVLAALITLYILSKLFIPEVGSRFRRSASPTSFVPMPKAPVNEDHQPIFADCDVRRAGQIATMQAKAKPQPMGGATHHDLGCRVLSPNATHECGPCRRRWSFRDLLGFQFVPKAGILPSGHG
jgi:hypothetical protein